MAGDRTTVARPYAEAVFEHARQNQALDDWSSMLDLVATMTDVKEASELLTNPKQTKQNKFEFCMSICDEHLSIEGTNFIRLLIDNDRLNVIKEIRKLYEEHKRDLEGTLDVEIISAFELDEVEKLKLSDALQSKLGKKISITSSEDRTLMGGIKIRAGDLVIDGTVKGQIARLATEFGL